MDCRKDGKYRRRNRRPPAAKDQALRGSSPEGLSSRLTFASLSPEMSTLDFLTEFHLPKCPSNKKFTVFLRYLPSSNSPFSFRQLSAILPAIHRPEQLPFYSTLWHFYYGWRGNFASPSVTMCYTALWWQLITDGELLEGSRIASKDT